MNCNHECNTCESSCTVNCPICDKKGRVVKLEAALNLVNNNSYIDKNKKVYICQNKKCTVTYFQEENPKYYTKEEVNVPIWFKETYSKYMVCYCYEIYINDIVNIFKNDNTNKKLTKEDILKHFTKKHDDCLHHNPLGEDCEKTFINAIEFAYHQKKGD